MLLVTANSKSRQYFAFFISIALLILPNIVFYFKKTLTISDIAYLILFILIVLSIFQRISYGFLILTPFIILSPLESLYIFNYEQPSSSHVIALFDETNIEEISGFLNATTLWILLILMGTGMIVILSIKQITCWQWDKKIRRWVLLAGLITVCLSLTEEFYFSDSQEDNHYNGLVAHQLDSINAARFMHLYPLGLPFRIIDFIQQRHGIAQANTMIKNFKFNSEQKPFTNERQIYVLVIGETARPDRWQLNGYQRPTNPLLTQLPNIISFTNMISAWAWTRMAVPVIVTRKPARNTNAFFAEKSIVSAFKEAGFKTYWLSMQGLLGVHESAIALHAHEADETYFLNPVDYKGAGGYDGKLLEEFSKLLHKAEQRQFIVLHTLGGHYNYAHRYPDAFDKFQPSLKSISTPNLYDKTQKEVMNNSYDNTVLYTDYVIYHTIKRLQQENAVSTLYYVADHGENLFDGQCDKSGHGHATEYDFRVAALWWSSDKYNQLQADKVDLLRSRKNSPLTTEAAFHTLMDIANIHYPQEDLSLSIASQQWRFHSRWTQTGLDFDQSERDPVCKTLVNP